MYLVPNKFMKFDNCMLKVGAEIIKILLKNKKIKYSTLYDNFKKIYKEDTDYIFLPALNFLYLLGKIEYKIKKDMVELVQ